MFYTLFAQNLLIPKKITQYNNNRLLIKYALWKELSLQCRSCPFNLERLLTRRHKTVSSSHTHPKNAAVVQFLTATNFGIKFVLYCLNSLSLKIISFHLYKPYMTAYLRCMLFIICYVREMKTLWRCSLRLSAQCNTHLRYTKLISSQFCIRAPHIQWIPRLVPSW
jgi:hypothetical protein